MVAKVFSVTFSGIQAKLVEVQVHIAPGLPAMHIVGLADKAVAESKERVKAAFHSLALSFPQKKITVNLAPAGLHKEGSHFDLPIALGLLAEMSIISRDELLNYIVVGELSLDGSINGVNGVLPTAINANKFDKGIICPYSNGSEATFSGNKNILATENLIRIINHFKCEQIISQPLAIVDNDNIQYPDLKDVKGQKLAKRALEIAAAGGHNIMMIGPPGSGKSMLAKRLPALLPPPSTEEMLDISIIYSVAGLLKQNGFLRNRPFCDPHHSSSMPAMVGGGRNAKPGSVTLAHHGVLFLDELAEFNRSVLDSLRQPLESGEINVSRINANVTYPARFILVAAMNPCKCGYFGNQANSCSKMPRCAEDYQLKVSGPLLDRFDIRIDVPAVNIFELENIPQKEESTAEVAVRVNRAREIQKARYKEMGYKVNAQADGEILEKYTALDKESKELIRKAVEKFSLSMRGYNRVLRVARTIADLYGSTQIDKTHLAEALQFRVVKLKV